MTAKTPGIKIPYFNESQYPLVSDIRCVEIYIPNDPAFLPQLAGLLALATKGFNYARLDYDRAQTLARMWTRAYLATDWGQCMSCEDVADCIETDAGVQNAITNLMQNQDSFPPQYPYGTNLPDEALSRDFASGTNPICNLDVLWAQCLAIAVTTNQAIMDVLEKVEVETNVVELATDLFSSVPLVATVKNIAGIDGVLALINYFQDSVAEEYAAQYTTTPGGVQDTIACALFCACRGDCVVSIDRIVGVLNDRLAVYTSPPSLAGLQDFIAAIAGVDIDTTFVVDMAFYVAWGAVHVANFLFGGRFDDVLQIVLALAVNDANDDWIILCTDCPEEWSRTVDFTSFDGGMTVNDGFGHWTDGVGWVGDCVNFGLNYLASILQMTLADAVEITGMSVTRTVIDFESVDTLTDRLWVIADSSGNWRATQTAANATDRVLEYSGGSDTQTTFGFTVHGGDGIACPAGSVVATSMTVTGFGIVPPELDENGWS